MSSLKSLEKSYIEESHDDLVLAMLKFDGVVGTYQLKELGVKSISKVITRLRNDGYVIKKVFIPRSSLGSKSQKREAVYVLTCGCGHARAPF